jgi:hypothetical protein
MVMPKAGLSCKPVAARSAGELTDRNRKAIEDGQCWIMRQALSQPLAQLILETAEVRGLAHEGRAIEMAKRSEIVAPMPLEGDKERTLLIQTQELAHQFHGQHFAVGQGGIVVTLPRTTARYQFLDARVTPAKAYDDEYIQVHLLPPLAL